MSYFEHTKRDVTEARLAGRREVAEMFAALLDDTARKLDSEEPEFDRQYLLEDLLHRAAHIAKNYTIDAPKLFPSLVPMMSGVPAYPLLDEAASGAQENTIDLSEASRGAWEAQTFDNGYPRHEHVGTPDERCLADIRSIYSQGPAVRCGRYYGHAIHETIFEERTK